MKKRENTILEASRFANESRARLAAQEIAKINEKAEARESFLDNYYSIKEAKEAERKNNIKLLEAARDDALASVIKAIYITALEAGTLTDNGIILAESMVDNWIKESGGANKILTKVGNNTYLLSRITQLVEQEALRIVDDIKSINEADEEEKDATDAAKDFIKDASKKEIKDFVSDVVDSIQKKAKADEKERAEKAAEKEEEVSADTEDSKEAPSEELELKEPEEKDESTDNETSNSEENSEDKTEDTSDKNDEKTEEGKESGTDSSSTDDSADIEIEIEDEEGESDNEEKKTSEEDNESSNKTDETEGQDGKEDTEAASEGNDSDEELDIEITDDDENKDTESDVEVNVPAEEENDSEESEIPETGEEGTDTLDDDFSEDDNESVEDSKEDEIDDEVDEELGEPLDDDEVDSDITIDGDSENSGKLFKALDKEDDVQKAIELIRTRVANAEEQFIRNNAEDKKKIDELIDKISTNVKTVENINKKDEKQAEVAQEAARYNKRKIADIRSNRPLTVMEKMTRTLTGNIIKDESCHDIYFNESGKLDIDLVVESAKVMYGFLETINTLQLEKVDAAYVKNILENM